MTGTNGNGNGKNGLFLKILVGLCVTLSGSAIVGAVVLYGDVRELKKADGLERRVTVLEELTSGINADRHKRTEIIQQIRDNDAELKRRIEALERKR